MVPLVQDHDPRLEAHLAAQDRFPSGYVEREFENDLRRERLEHGFLLAHCER